MRKKRDIRCALCPFRESPTPCGVLERVSSYQVVSNNWVASGRKQLRVFIAMYDNDILSEGCDFTPMPNYLRRDADIIRDQIARNSPGTTGDFSPEMTGDLSANNLVCREIRLAQFANGPGFRRVDYIRRGGNRLRMLRYNIPRGVLQSGISINPIAPGSYRSDTKPAGRYML